MKTTLRFGGWVTTSLGLIWSGIAETSRGAELPPVPQSIVDVAKQAPLTRYGRNLSGGGHTGGAWNGGWQIPLAVAAWGGNTSADARLLQQINYNLAGNTSISANGGYPAQHEMHVTGMYAILRQSDRFWNGVLDSTQRQKIDLVMKAAVVASAYTTSDATYAGGFPVTTLDGDTNVNRAWNPNYREGMFGNLITGMVYFGGADQVNNILNNYNHNAFVAELQAAGLSNIAETFTWAANHPGSGAPSGQIIEQRVRNYTYLNESLLDPFDLYAHQTRNTYSKHVKAGLNNGQGILQNGVPTGVIVSGAEDLPNIGELGMLQEFDTVDASGPRSSITYSYDGFRPNLTSHVAVLVGGYWEEGDVADDLLRRLDVGITDLIYKLEHGYRNYQHGKGNTTPFDINAEDWSWSFRTTIPLWEQVLRPYHFAVTDPTGSVTSKAAWQSFTLGDSYTGQLIVAFDAIPHGDEIDGAIGLLGGEADEWGDLAAIFRFNPDGFIDARNGGAYDADAGLAYDAETVYHVRMVIDVATQTYSVFVTPEGGDEVLLADGFAFRSEQALLDVLDHWALRHVEGSFTVENFAVVTPEPGVGGVLGVAVGAVLLRSRSAGRR